MKIKKRHLSLLLVPLFILGILALAQDEDRFFDSDFDGAWAGYIRMPTESGKRNFPFAVNLNCQEKKGSGFVLFPDDLITAPGGFDLFSIIDLKRKGLRVTATFEISSSGEGGNETYVHTLVLNYKRAKDFIKGTLKSTDPDLGKGIVFLYRQGAARKTQKIWQGKVKIDNKKTPVILQVIQKDAVGGDSPFSDSVVTGAGFIGEDYGPVKLTTFDGTNLTGQLKLSTETVFFDLKITGLKLKGRLNFFSFSRGITLVPAGTKGKIMGLTKVIPDDLTIDETNLVDIRGKNLYPGVMLHLDDPLILVDAVDYRTLKRVMGCFILPRNVFIDQNVSLRAVNPDGEYVDLADAFITKMKENPFTVSFSGDIQPVFNQSCAVSGCHSGSAPAEGLNLSADQAFNNIVGISSTQNSSLFLIKRFDPDMSYLIRKIKGEGISGSRMPRGRTPLSLTLIAMFENWVREGAENN